MVFSPSASDTLDTDNIGTFNSTSYALSATSYVGLTFNGQSLSFSEGGAVTGNAATSGLLDVLNDYLAAQPKLSISDVTAGEAHQLRKVHLCQGSLRKADVRKVSRFARLCENSDGVQGMMSKFYLNRAKHDCDFSFAHFAI